MSLKSQGTNLYVVNPNGNIVVKVGCPRGISGVGGTWAEQDATCLEDEGMSYEPGSFDAGSISVEFNFDPQDSSHSLLYQLWNDGANGVQFAIGFSDGTVDPTVDSAGDIATPTSRTFYVFHGFITSFPLEFAAGQRVTGTMTIRVNGKPQLIKKV